MDPQRPMQVRQETEQNQKTEQNRPRKIEGPIRAAEAAKALLAGAPVREFPPKTLSELAARIGNSAMLALAQQGIKEPEQAAFRMPAGEPGTIPAKIPKTDCQEAAPAGLAAGTAAGAGFDAAGLRA